MQILLPPSNMSYDYEEAVLINEVEIGTNHCQVKGSRPLQFKADSLPQGLKLNGDDGRITGSPQQLDTDFRKYAVRCANQVGETLVMLSLMCSKPITTQDDNERLVNKDVEARVGQKVRGTEAFIKQMRMKGLKDPSATSARNAHDNMRSNKLVQAVELQSSLLPSPLRICSVLLSSRVASRPWSVVLLVVLLSSSSFLLPPPVRPGLPPTSDCTCSFRLLVS
mmetsp:Transcript_23782/g.77467  ORF Transcript_23782/g.77467 Transcript_23782/m.77467 type:complete len:223 (-) Transcript_23782:3111-3779(-)